MAAENGEDKVYVALPDSYEDGRSVLSWVLSHFSRDKTKIIITHVIASPFKGSFDLAPWVIERERMELVLSKYLSQCVAQQFRAKKLVHMSDDIAEGLVQLVGQQEIKNLVMNAAPNNEMTEIVSETGNRVAAEANPSCKIWFVHDENLIFVREAYSDALSSPSSSDLENAHSSSYASPSSASSSTSRREGNVIVDISLKEMLKEASIEAGKFQRIANEESNRRERAEKEMFHAYKKAMSLLTKVAEELQVKEQNLRDVGEVLERENQENNILIQKIDDMRQEKNRMQKEIENLQAKNDELRCQRDENLNKYLVASEKNISLERKCSDIELSIKDLVIISASSGDRLDSLQSEYNKLLIEKDVRDKEIHSGLSNTEFSLQELVQATENFNISLKIGEGGSGFVYKGSLYKTTVAIKVLQSQNVQSLSQFKQEVTILTKVRHPNLVTLMGACSEASALVYEYLPNGSLEDRLKCANNTPPLTWQVRTRIIGEVCLALIFLHSNKPELVVHGDLKPENILLDANLVSKLSDFGISRILKQPNTNMTAFCHTSNPGGTLAYMDPEYLTTGMLTPKSDIYSFGIIILRILTGRSPFNIARGVRDGISNGSFLNMLDQTAGSWPLEQAKKLAIIGLRCADVSRNNRPDLVRNVWVEVEPLMTHALTSIPSSSRHGFDDDEHAPTHFICPIYQEIMRDPCIAADGFTYESEGIQRWLNTHNTSPMTNLVLPHHNLIPNLVLRSAIQDWLERHPQS